MKTILAINSADGSCQVLLWRGQDSEGYCLGCYISHQALDQATKLPLVIADLLKKEPHLHLDRIVVTTGPGRFTAIRIGLAAAQGLGLALDIPVIGLSSLAVLGLNVPLIDPKEMIMAVIPGPQERVFAQPFDSDSKSLWSQPCLMTVDEIIVWLQLRPTIPVVLVGTAAKALELILCKHDVKARRDRAYPDLCSIASHSVMLDPCNHPARPLYSHLPVYRLVSQQAHS